MTNSNITVSDRLAEKLKNSELGEFLTEEDIYEISKEAVRKAFFTSSSGYNVPPIVTMAEQCFTKAMQEESNKLAAEIAATPEFREAMISGALRMLPNAMLQGMRSVIDSTALAASRESVLIISDMIGRMPASWPDKNNIRRAAEVDNT